MDHFREFVGTAYCTSGQSNTTTYTASVLNTHDHPNTSCAPRTWPLTQQPYSAHMATHLTAILTRHNLFSPHMATQTPLVLTTHGHSHTICSHHTWSLKLQLHSPHMATHTTASLTTHGHSDTICSHHTWPLRQQLHSPHMAYQTPSVLTTHGHSGNSCTHHTWPRLYLIDQIRYKRNRLC